MSSTPESTGVKRRDFLKVLGVATATTATLGCSSEDVGKLVPYVTHPDQTVPSVSNYYATTCRECSAACGVLAESREGRAFKLEGNPEHPLNRGAICSRGQAAVQGLLNPDRYRGPMMRQANGRLAPVTWDVAMQRFNQLLGQVQSQGRAAQAVFVNQHESGSFPAFLDQWLADFGMPAHLSYDAEAMPQVVAANRQAYGVAWPALDFTAARLVVSFGADFLDQFGLPVPHQLDWADARAKGAAAPRMIYVGPRRSLTGLNADQWIACRPGSELAIVNFLRGQGSAAQAAQASDVPAATLEALQREVAGTRPSMILAGSNTPTAYELALAVNQLNQSAGNVGVTIKPATPITAFEGIATGADVRELTERMAQGGVSMLMVRGVNPVHTTPKALGFAAALAKVPVKVSFSSFPDETTELCDLVLPDHHALEAWGDSQPLPNVIALQQPAQDPIFQTRQTADVLILAAKANQNTAARYGFADYRAYLISRFPGGAPAFTRALQTGLAAGTIAARTATRPAATTRRQVQGGLDATQGDMYLMVYPSTNLGDGRGANKPWLQEIPDPVTKICWQTVAEIHPTTAKRLGVQNGDRVTVATSAGSMTLPAYVYLGIRPDTVAIQLGRGHQGSTNVAFDAKAGAPHYTGYGRYADRVGQNPLSILPVAEGATAGELVLTATKARVTKADGHDELVTTEGSARQHGRGIGQAMLVSELRPGGVQSDRGAEAVGARGPTPESNRGAGGAEATGGAQQEPAGQGGEQGTGQTAGDHAAGGAEGGHHSFVGDASHEFLPGLRSPVANDAQGDFGDSTSKDKGMYSQNHWSKMAARRWAMTIDLARCTGCSACVTACYAENNLPTVGAAWQVPTVAPDRTGFGANILRSREMSWIRLERYYEGAENAENEFQPDFDTRFVPMLCQHCGNAPCEPVCPVYATYHSPDGLNVQVYNRCVGTRYCSNNCPYKVRYFNWFGYGEPNRPQYAFPEPLELQLNPDVTVRGKGVMEKCTFCVQRIREAENRADLENRTLEPDEFTVACAQACPSRAITFGDAADNDWTVASLAVDQRSYHVFEELNTYTAVVYLKKINHPGPGAAGPATA